MMAPSSTTRATPATTHASGDDDTSSPASSDSTLSGFKAMTAGSTSSEMRFITFISGLRAGPEVSLNGSPTVSPMTAALWASDPLPPSAPSSMYFLALSHAPPALDWKLAMRAATTMPEARNAPRAMGPKAKPTMTGMSTASSAGVASSRSDARVQMSMTGP